MNKNIKALSIALIFLIALLGLSTVVSASSDLYDISLVKINGMDVSTTSITDALLADSTEVEVWIIGMGNSSTCPGGDVNDCAVNDVKVKAWIGGYEYGDIEATSSAFTIQPGVSYKKTLNLEIPSDLDVTKNDYTLYVEVYDGENSEKKSYQIFTERPSHNLDILDVIYDASVKAGEKTPLEVRIENLGDSKEEDIKVEAILGEIDSDATFISELASFEEKNENEESSQSAFLKLIIPKDTVTDYYDLTVKVTYNKGHNVEEKTYKVWVDGKNSPAAQSTETAGNGKTTITISSTNLQGTEGSASSFSLNFLNGQAVPASYTIKVNGIAQWAQATATPGALSLEAGASQTVNVALTPNSDAAGDKEFSIQVLDADGKLVKDIAMTMHVEKSSSLFGTSSVVKIAFIIVIVIIILIGLIVAFRKLKDDDDDTLEPKDGQTYY